MKEISVYRYDRFADFLSSYIRLKKDADPKFSYEWLCRRSGINAPSTLGMIASGRRLPSQAMVHKISTALNLTKRETEYAQALVGFEKSKNPNEKTFFANQLVTLRPVQSTIPLNLEAFQYISSWYHIAILEMLNLEDFQLDPNWISERLGRKITPKVAKEAIDRLQRLNLVEVHGSKIRRRENLETGFDIPSEAVKAFHGGMLQLGQEALLNQPVAKRFFKSLTLSIHTSKMPLAKEMINEFIYKFSEAMDVKEGDETYQLTLGFFSLTQSINGGKNDTEH